MTKDRYQLIMTGPFKILEHAETMTKSIERLRRTKALVGAIDTGTTDKGMPFWSFQMRDGFEVDKIVLPCQEAGICVVERRGEK